MDSFNELVYDQKQMRRVSLLGCLCFVRTNGKQLLRNRGRVVHPTAPQVRSTLFGQLAKQPDRFNDDDDLCASHLPKPITAYHSHHGSLHVIFSPLSPISSLSFALFLSFGSASSSDCCSLNSKRNPNGGKPHPWAVPPRSPCAC